jgi:hypothetical protein
MISQIAYNMDISRGIIESKSDNPILALIQKVAILTVFPLALIALFEAVIKNMIVYNLLNLGIVVINHIHLACSSP